MHFVPIQPHPEALRRTEPLWVPFVKTIAENFGTPFAHFFDLVSSEQIQIGVVWDGEKAHALVGWQLKNGGADLIAEIVWLEGEHHENWQHLWPELEKYLTEHLKVSLIRPMPRPGWARMLKKLGFKTTHYIMEKRYA